MLTLEEAVREIERAAVHPETGLPDEVFRLVTKLTPMINVDLLIKNEAGGKIRYVRPAGIFPAESSVLRSRSNTGSMPWHNRNCRPM